MKEKIKVANDNALWVNTVSNYVIAFTIIVIFGMFAILIVNFKLATEETKPTQEPKILSKVVKELGESVYLNPSTFVENADYIDENGIKVRTALKTSAEFSFYDTGLIVSKDKQYLEVGSYEIDVYYKQKKHKVVLEVQDTTAPEFISFSDTVSMQKGKRLDASTLCKVKDYSETTIQYEDVSKVNFDKEGTYSAKISATDEYGNKTTKPLTIKIVSDSKGSSSTSQSGSMKGKTKTFATEAETRAFGEACLKDGRATSYYYSIQPDGTYLATFS